MIYSPAEDSYLLSKVLEKQIPKLLEKNNDLKFLEIGCGSGIQLKTLSSLGIKKQNIFSCDINPEAVNRCKKLGFSSIVSDLFSKISGKYDTIIFNPPYLPLDENEPKSSGVATTGGIFGGEIINRFLKHAKKHLAKKGRIFLVLSSLTKGANFSDYRKKILDSEKLFFEKLFVLELKV